MSDGSGSPLRPNKSSLQFRSGLAQDLLYEQHAQLLRDSRHALHSPPDAALCTEHSSLAVEANFGVALGPPSFHWHLVPAYLC